MGGGTTVGTEAENTCEIIDLDDPQPNWRPTQSMKHARYYAYPVLLPNRTVLIIGGRGGHKEHAKGRVHPATQTEGEWQPPPQDPLAVREPELFNPANETWMTLAPMACDRLYHASALLLPDGRVLTAGSNPMSGLNELRIEIYHPPYLFQGPRPEIESVPNHVSYGQLLEIGTKEASEIEEVVLIRPGVTTHCVDTDQRHVELAIQNRTGGKLAVTIPMNPNLLPPGYYMLFILSRGIPSRAKFVQIQQS
jgi:hypothetical protein